MLTAYFSGINWPTQRRVQPFFKRKNLLLMLVLLLLSGCLSAPAKVSNSARQQIKSVRVVSLEAPPLEVWPDLLDARMPVYAHFDNMALPLSVERKLYRYPGDILIAGKVGDDDSVDSLERLPHSSGWSPSKMVLDEALAQLSAAKIQTSAQHRVLPLSLTASKRDAELSHWRDAIDTWYQAESAKLEPQDVKADAVLQLGIRRYKVFAGQMSLQLLIKLIDSSSGRVIARSDEDYGAYEAPVDALFANEGESFKSLLRQHAAMLLAQGLRDIGLITR